MNRPRHHAARLFALALVAGCGGDSETPMEPEIVTTPPPEILTGLVVASDTFTVPATSDPFALAIYSSGGVIPDNIAPTTGWLMVFSVQDVSRPGLVCTQTSTAASSLFLSHEQSNCAVLVAEPVREEGFVSVQSTTGRRNYYLQSTYQLLLDPEPA